MKLKPQTKLVRLDAVLVRRVKVLVALKGGTIKGWVEQACQQRFAKEHTT